MLYKQIYIFTISYFRTDMKGCTPFYLAVQEGHVEVVKHLLRVEGVDINLGQSKKITPLIIAAMNGYVEIIQVWFPSIQAFMIVDNSLPSTVSSGPRGSHSQRVGEQGWHRSQLRRRAGPHHAR